MKHHMNYLVVCLASFLIGIFPTLRNAIHKIDNLPKLEISNQTDNSLRGNETSERDDQYKEALGGIWIEADKTQVGEYKIVRKCISTEETEFASCKLSITRRRKVLDSFETDYRRKHWLRFGFFDFLGKKEKQLVVHTYSGGAHCCYDYYIYDLGKRFQVLYKSSEFDSANEIGNELVPVDIDKDGIYEFYQDVMAFDYLAKGGHATSTFPPAIFAFDSLKGRYVLSESKFSDFILRQMQQELDNLGPWAADYEKRSGQKLPPDELNEIAVRIRFLYMVYAAQRTEGWTYFKDNYKTSSGNGYQDQFRDKFIKDFQELFAKDPTYKSVYSR